MVKSHIDWSAPELPRHSKIKHDIIREYFERYLTIRCRNPLQRRFRILVVDGFAGSGLYKDGQFGSPILLLHAAIAAAKKHQYRPHSSRPKNTRN